MSLPIIFLKFLLQDICFRVLLVSAIRQHESATYIHTSPPSWLSLPSPTTSHPSRLSQSTGFSSLCHTQIPTCHLCYIWYYMCFHASLSVFIPPSPILKIRIQELQEGKDCTVLPISILSAVAQCWNRVGILKYLANKSDSERWSVLLKVTVN